MTPVKAKSKKKGILLAAALCLLSAPSSAQAESSWLHEMRVGVLAHDTDINLWGAVPSEHGVDINAELVFTPEQEMLGGALRPNFGASLNSCGDTSHIYGGGVWEYEWKNGVFFDTAVGLSANSETGKNLGSAILLRLALEAGYNLNPCNRVSLMMDHISNANTADPNPGIDNIGIRFGHKF
ncbi:acyloxyacyl hydrolase [Chlorobium sp. N1]|uniref:acyloxyacyl hydrolase n=1 Tax=Chlorobium sp. N1 TaxID=2491138 RepID=UPI00103FE7BF|nr:acyloxyacyl hydrolase [Chlorobium sp. N1]TCD47660.1 acyloxyacyl hydrolase [Chlorobium sp. N1]